MSVVRRFPRLIGAAGLALALIVLGAPTAGAVRGISDRQITQTDSPDPASPGQVVTYTLTAKNNGPDRDFDVEVVDRLPEDATIVSVSSSKGSCELQDPDLDPDFDDVTCFIGVLASGATATVSIQVTFPSAGVKTSTASIVGGNRDPIPINNVATATTIVVNPSADLSIAKTDSPDPVTAGQPLTYTLTATNNGSGPASSISVTDNLPEQVTIQSVSPSESCTAADSSEPEVTCSFASLGSGQSVTVTIVVIPQAVNPAAPGTITNTASVTAASPSDPNAANNTATAVTTVYPACTITGTEGEDELNGTAGTDVICALGGPDLISARGGDDLVLAGEGDDLAVGRGGNDYIEGGAGADELIGDVGADRLFGQAGMDELDALDEIFEPAVGNDTLDGGTEFDLCLFDPGDQVAGCP